MAKAKDEKIPDLHTSWEGYAGVRVEELIKVQFEMKVGYINRSSEKEEDGMFHVRGFRDESSYQEWIADKENNDSLIITEFTIPDLSSTTASYVLRLDSGSPNTIVSTDGSVKLRIRFVSALFDPITQSTSDSGEDGELSIQTKINNVWTTKGEMIIRSLPMDSEDYIEVDISEYLADGEQSVRVIVKGETSEAYTRTLTYSVTNTTLSLSFGNSWERPITNNALGLSYYITGAVPKLLHVLVDGSRKSVYDIDSKVYRETPYLLTVSDSSQDTIKVCGQGVHTIEAWLTVDMPSVDVESEHITSQVLIIDSTQPQQDYIWFNDFATSLTNWTEQTILRYAVYSADSDRLPVSFALWNYTRTEKYAEFNMGEPLENTKHTLSNMIEVEENDEYFSLHLDVMSGDTVLFTKVISVDNSNKFSPTEGADFIFNPKLRTNQEANPATVINAADGSQVDAVFSGFGFVNDGYTIDAQGNRCFRTLAGDSLHITGYEAFSGFLNGVGSSSLTIEIDFAVRNITNEDDVVLRMCTYNSLGNPIGYEMRGLTAMFGSVNKQVKLDQDIAWSEDVRTHVAVNIVNNLAESGINYIRMFINGKSNREFSYEPNDRFVQTGGTSGGILIGSPTADIDIYSIRIYKKALSSSDIQKDYEASLPTSAQKLSFRDENAITNDSGFIDYNKAKAKYNTLLWKYNDKSPNTQLASYLTGEESSFKGDLVVSIIGDDKHSGTLHNMKTKGQGTSAMGYWKWNQRFEFDEGGYFMSNTGERIDGKWQLMDGIPFSARNDAKINWASSQQSHKLGATALYNDCWKEVVKNNSITLTPGGQDFTKTDKGYADCRVSVRQKPFLMFVQQSANDTPTFYATYTFGPGKGDKPTFGYDKSVFPKFTMLEGCDNNKPLVMHRIPWDNSVKTNSKGDVFLYNTQENWEISMGSEKPEENLVEEFKEAFNFIYMNHTAIRPFIGSYSDMIGTEGLSTAYDLWVTRTDANAAKFDLYRYDEETSMWVKAGMNKATLNLNSQLGGIIGNTESDWDDINNRFIEARKKNFRPYTIADSGDKVYTEGEGIERYFNVRDALFTMMFLRLLAGTDNRGKNTYLYKAKAGDKIMFFQDDLDTIFSTDNQGRKTKPYYIEEHDLNPDGQAYWNSETNAFYNLMEDCYSSECSEMMREILSAMFKLGDNSVERCYQKYFYDVQDGFPAVVYNEVARLLYEEAERARVEGRYISSVLPLPQSLGDQLQAEKEWNNKRLAYFSSYAGFGNFAAGDGVTDALVFRSVKHHGNDPQYRFELTPHQWIYPVVGVGSSSVPSRTRVPAGETYTFKTISSDQNTNVRINGISYYRKIGNFGAWSIGEDFTLSGKRLVEFEATGSDAFAPTSIGFSNSTQNIELLDLTGRSTITGGVKLTPMTRLKTLKLSGTSISSVTLPSTDSLTSVELPKTLAILTINEQPKLASVRFEGFDSLQEVYVDHSKAKSFNSQGLIENLYTKYVNTGIHPNSITILDADWKDLPISVLTWILDKIPEISLTGRISIKEPTNTTSNINFELKNRINAKFGNVDSDVAPLRLVYNLVPLTGITLQGSFDFGPEYPKTESTAQFSVLPLSENANNHTSIVYEIIEEPQSSVATIDQKTGLLTATNLSVSEDFVTIKAKAYTKSTSYESSKRVGIWDRDAQVGDVVYYDGTYSSAENLNSTKTSIGVCIYTAPRYPYDMEIDGVLHKAGEIVSEYHDPNDIHTRLMAALSTVTCKSKGSSTTRSSFYWGPNKSSGYLGAWVYIDGVATFVRTTNGTLNTTTLYNLPSIKNLSAGGSVKDTTFRNEDNILNGGFTPWSADSVFGDGFAFNEPTSSGNDYKKERTLTKDLASLVDSSLEGVMVNSAMAKTLKQISARNIVLNEGLVAGEGDSLIQVFPQLEVPTDLTMLSELMDEITAHGEQFYEGQTSYAYKWTQICFPAASAAYLYEPQIKSSEKLNEAFKKHHWFLPTSGLIARAFWFYKYSSAFYSVRNLLSWHRETSSSAAYELCGEMRDVESQRCVYYPKNGSNDIFLEVVAWNEKANVASSVLPICAF